MRCYNSRLDITTEARVIALKWDCIRNQSAGLTLGDYEYNYFQEMTSAMQAVSQIIGPGNTVVAERVSGVLNAINTQLRYQKNAAQKQDVRAILFEDTDPASPTYGAMCIGTQGFQIADSRTTDGRDWNWKTAFTAKGGYADVIIAGFMLADRIHGGTLTLGGQGNGNGVCRVLDANGNEVIRLDNAGIKILKGLLQIGTLFSVDTAGNVIANSLQSSNAQITGGSIQIQAMAEYYEPIKLSTYDGWSIAMGPNGVTSRSPNGTYSRVSPAGVDTGTYSGTAMTLKASMTPEGSILAQDAYDNVTSESPNVNVLINGLFRRSASSSRKYKIDITDVIPENLNPEKLYEISVKSFKYKEGYLAKDDQRAKQDIIGLIAEEVAEVYPQAVNYVNGKPEMWNAQILIPAMLKLIQSQNERIKRLECQL